MKRFIIFSLTVFSFLIFDSCKKTDSPVNKGIEGVWVGKYGFGNESPDAYYSFNIKAGGVIEELSATGKVLGTGTWKLEYDIFTAKYAYAMPSKSSFSIIGAYDPSKNQILGNWGYKSSATNGGLWEMKKSK